MIPQKSKHGSYTPLSLSFASVRKAFERRPKTLQQPTATKNHPSYHRPNKPSKQIRLIKVKDQQKLNAPLELELSIHTLKHAPEFYAVSYTWGSGGLSETVLIRW
ncbi:hypothetical protein FPOAC2_07297 [Fusarium poae]